MKEMSPEDLQNNPLFRAGGFGMAMHILSLLKQRDVRLENFTKALLVDFPDATGEVIDYHLCKEPSNNSKNTAEATQEKPKKKKKGSTSSQKKN